MMVCQEVWLPMYEPRKLKMLTYQSTLSLQQDIQQALGRKKDKSLVRSKPHGRLLQVKVLWSSSYSISDLYNQPFRAATVGVTMTHDFEIQWAENKMICVRKRVMAGTQKPLEDPSKGLTALSPASAQFHRGRQFEKAIQEVCEAKPLLPLERAKKKRRPH